MGRHAYLIQAHSQFDLLKILLELLDDGRNDIFIHIDRRSQAPLDELKAVCTKSEVTFTDRIEVRWGGPSQIWSELILLKAAVSKGGYDYFHLLSGVDLPVKTQDYIHGWFDEHQGTEFVSFCTNPRSVGRRLLWAPFPEYGSIPLCVLTNNIFKAVQQLLRVNPYPGLDARMGANWFSITEELAGYVVSREDWIRSTFAHRTNCDELFLQTIVWNSEFLQRCFVPRDELFGIGNMSNLRLVDWSRGESSRHPWVLQEADFDLLKDSPQLFARKFTMNNKLPLMIREMVKTIKIL